MVNLTARRGLTDHDRKTVADCLGRAKARTSGEIMVVVAWQSDLYTTAALVFGLALTIIIALALYLLYRIDSVPAMALLAGGLFFFSLGLAELLYLPICFLPRSLKRRAVRRHAREQFAAHALHAVPGRAAVLILISRRERMIELIADEGIYTKADAGQWKIIANELTYGLRQGDRAQPLCRAIDACAALLATHFPAGNLENNNR